jgi:hypothetical protein
MSGGLFPGRLGLASARIPQVDRHGLMWLFRGKLYVEDGTLHFRLHHPLPDGFLPVARPRHLC